ncbi:hypothetical protein N7462_009103 [Penicillium macrosclerotiorum]|uniref:uncharacterized protein n=1 Tax=Penicillium macrosclerotiorum TaxID=303699 RepID=UPI002547482E|nr:uncharacterized protein N7462_009103 [Penicillium macrosclerotiorum]KAJ5676206.1 hypothetical protein N7462_009103 [Penicillium macrosclerotiorum]
MTKLINVINSIAKDEYVLLFVQFEDLMVIVSRALAAADISHRMARQTNPAAIRDFTKPTAAKPRPKVLMLQLGSAMAAGLNLQCANHVIFLSPLHAPTQHDYEAGMTQAIGRVRRFGQEKSVHVYHMLVPQTAEVNIYQGRHGGLLVQRDDRLVVVPTATRQAADLLLEGPPLTWAQ